MSQDLPPAHEGGSSGATDTAPPRCARYTALGWIALSAAVSFYAYWQGYRAWQNMHGNDFRHLYLGSLFLRYGQNPYDAQEFLRWRGQYFGPLGINPYVYPPTTGLALRFLTLWDWRTAQQVWFILNQLMVIAALLLCARLFLGFRDPWPLALIVLLAATSIPLWRTSTAGQLNCVLLLIYCGIYRAIRRRTAWFAGFLVGFGILFKLVPGIFVIYFLWKRRWRELLWSGIWFGVVLGISVAMAGWKVHLAYWPVMKEMGYGKSVWQDILIRGGTEPFYRDPYNQSFNSLFHHLLAPDPVPHEDPRDYVVPWLDLGARGATVANALTYIASLALLAIALWAIGLPEKSPIRSVISNSQSAIRNPQSEVDASATERDALAVSLMIILSLLLPSILWDHYVVALFLPQIVLLACLRERKQWFTWQMGLLIAASVLLAWPIAFDQRAFCHGIGLLAMSAKLIGVLVLFGVTLSLRTSSCIVPAPPCREGVARAHLPTS